MEGQENNIPAFPHTIERDNTGNPFIEPGMTLRDYFAAKAMQSLISRQHLSNGRTNELHNIPNDAYEFANAMLKARNQ